jgi:hypothetical protein
MDDALANKLFFKPEYRAAILDAPEDYLERLGIPVIGDLSVRSSLDFIQVFVTAKINLLPIMPDLIRALKPNGLLWISYPKGGSKVQTDLNRDILWAETAKFGLAGVAMISIDEIWSAMRFRPSGRIGK